MTKQHCGSLPDVKTVLSTTIGFKIKFKLVYIVNHILLEKKIKSVIFDMRHLPFSVLLNQVLHLCIICFYSMLT